MRSLRSALMILGVGALTFAAVFTFLLLSRSEAAPEVVVVVAATPAPVSVGPPSDSVAGTLVAGQTAVGVPSAGSEQLLLSVQPGDRLDVLASLPAPADGRPVSVVVVSGARVLRPATTSGPLLVAVSGPDAMVLAHLVLGGTHLALTVWPDGVNPPRQPPLDERTARALLGLPPVSGPSQPTPAPVAVTATATPRPVTYTVLVGESLYSAAARLGVDPGALWWANRSLIDPTVPLVAGTTLQVPLFDGFLYQAQPGDTWDTVAATFGMPAADLWKRNELPENATLVSGMLLFIPRPS